jgi:hypothetical protein
VVQTALQEDMSEAAGSIEAHIGPDGTRSLQVA